VFDAAFLFEHLLLDGETEGSSHDFGKDVIPHLVKGGADIYAHDFTRSCVNMINGEPYWRDVGTVDAYWEANIDLTRVEPELNLYDRNWPIWTFQEQIPPAKFVFDDESCRGMAIDSIVSGGCIVSGSTVKRSLLSSNVRVYNHSVIEDCGDPAQRRDRALGRGEERGDRQALPHPRGHAGRRGCRRRPPPLPRHRQGPRTRGPRDAGPTDPPPAVT